MAEHVVLSGAFSGVDADDTGRLGVYVVRGTEVLAQGAVGAVSSPASASPMALGARALLSALRSRLRP